MTEEPVRWSESPTLRKAVDFALECGCTTLGEPCPHHQRRIDADEYDELYPFEDPHAYEKHYGDPDRWDPDR